MDEHYFSISAYNSILGILGEVDPALTEQFATFFTITPDGKYYQCVNYDGYMGFLSDKRGYVYARQVHAGRRRSLILGRLGRTFDSMGRCVFSPGCFLDDPDAVLPCLR